MKKFAVQALAGLAILAAVLSTGSAYAQKVGVIDARQVIASLPEAQTANARIQATQKAWTDSLENMKTAFQAKYDAYQKIADQMTPESKKKASDDMQAMQDNFNRFRDTKFGQEGELAQLQNSLLKPIFDKVQGAIGNFAKKEKFAVILDKQNTLYAEGSVDVTNKFADYLKTAK